MPKDSYDPNASSSNVEPLVPGQYPNCTLARIHAFRQKNKDPDTGDEFIRIKLALYWDSGYTLPDNDEPYYVVDGFVTFSFHERSNLGKMLHSLGVIEFGKPIEYEYELEGDYEGKTFNELPLYEGGPKKDAEIPLSTLKVNDIELIGFKATLVVGVKPSGYNKVELVMRDAPKAPSRLGPRKADDSGKAEAPVSTTTTTQVAQQKDPLWLTWRTKSAAIKWAMTLKNDDGSLAYNSKLDAEVVWHALYATYQQEVFEPTDREFYWHWHRWHAKALTGEGFDFQDEPTEEEAQFLYQVRGTHA